MVCRTTRSVPESELKTLLFSNFVSQALRASMNKVALNRPATPMEPGSDHPVNDAQPEAGPSKPPVHTRKQTILSPLETPSRQLHTTDPLNPRAG